MLRGLWLLHRKMFASTSSSHTEKTKLSSLLLHFYCRPFCPSTFLDFKTCVRVSAQLDNGTWTDSRTHGSSRSAALLLWVVAEDPRYIRLSPGAVGMLRQRCALCFHDCAWENLGLTWMLGDNKSPFLARHSPRWGQSIHVRKGVLSAILSLRHPERW